MAEKRFRGRAPGGPKGAPAAVRRQIGALIESFAPLLGRNLAAVYLHGSLASGGFRAGRSDIDLLLIVDRPLLRDSKLGLAQTLLERSCRPAPIELSVLARAELEPWRHPAPYQFHYSEAWRDRLTAETAGTGWLAWPDGVAGTDPDLAAHVFMARAAGIALLGPPPVDLLPDVPRADVLDALLYDLVDAERAIERDPVYVVLNLCRALRYAREGVPVSKEAGGAWAIEALPPERAQIVERVLAVRRGELPDADWDAPALRRFARDLLAEFRAAAGLE